MKDAIILAAGESSRFGKNKAITKLNGIPLIYHALDFCKENKIENVIVVLSKKSTFVKQTKSGIGFHINPVLDVCNSYILENSFTPKIKFVEQDPRLYGPAAGIMAAAEHIQNDYFVLFGDNFIKGKIELNKKQKEAEVVIGFLKLKPNLENLRFAVINKKNQIAEKPHNKISGKFFIGFAFFKHKTIKNLRKLVPSIRGEYEITDFINFSKNTKLFNMKNTFWGELTYKQDKKKLAKYIKNIQLK